MALTDLTQMSASSREALSREISGRVKLVYFDIDGTLLDSNASLPGSAINAIKRIQSLGVKTAVASGRPVFAAQPLIDQLGLSDAGLFCTGAMLFDPAQNRLLSCAALAREDVLQVVELARQLSMHCELYTSNDYYIEHATDYTAFHTHYLKREPLIGSFTTELLSSDIFKIQLVVNENTELEKLLTVQETLPHLGFATGHGADRPDIIFSSLTSPDADKHRAFQSLAEHHGVNAENIMSLGDAGSDKVFLQLAGYGIAMGNAKADVQACADFVTHHVDNHGLAYALDLIQAPDH